MNKQPIWQTIILIILLAALIVACGPAGTEGNEAPSATELNGESNDPAAAAPQSNGEAGDSDVKEFDANGIEVGFTEDGHPYRGKRDASVILEEFSDYQCPFCARFYNETAPSLEENQIANGELKLIFYDFPLTSLHPQAVAAANAARCAGEQGAASYWGMHDLLFANGNAWGNNEANAAFSNYAQQLGLDTAQFNECQTSLKYSDNIQADLDFGRSRGISSTPSFFINNQPLIGAQPLTAFNQAIAAVSAGGQIAANEPDSAPPSQPAVAPTPAVIPTDNGAIAMGDPSAPVTIIEYTDYQCPFCQRHSQETMPAMITEMIETGRVYYIMKDFPLDSLHPNARTAAAAARCAGDQEAYWEMHDAIFDNQAEWAGQDATSVLAGLAEDLGLDMDSYNECMSSSKYDEAVQANLEEGAGLGVSATPYFFVNGFPVRGAIPFDRFEIGIGMAEAGTLADAYVPSEAAAQPTAVPQPSEPIDVPIDGAFAMGDPDAPVIMVEYTDFQCPFCSRHYQQTFPQIKSNFIDTGLVYYVFKDFPLTSIHPQAVLSAEAARCAGDQDAYVEMHDMLFATQSSWSGQSNAAALFAGYADQLGLDTAVFTECLETTKHQTAVQADLDEGTSFGVRGTPAFFINGNFVSGAQPYSAFEEAINGLLNQ